MSGYSEAERNGSGPIGIGRSGGERGRGEEVQSGFGSPEWLSCTRKNLTSILKW